jgi:hypothetical protein
MLAQVAISVILGGVMTATLSPPRQALAQPAPFLISPYFGEETITQGYSAGHQALDFGTLDYERVLAGADGTVGTVDWFNDNCHQSDNDQNCGFGLYIRIDHANGYQTYYAHLSATAFGFSDAGAQVIRGQVIGTGGHTGWSTGPHLHFEVRLNNTPVNPSNPSLWIDGQWANPSRPIPTPANGEEIVVDDQDNGFSRGCTAGAPCPFWFEANASYNNHMWWTWDNNNTEDYWARWNPNISKQGIYEVYVHIPNINATTWQAPYTISHYDGQRTAIVDQLGLSNQWVSIGVYRFHQGTTDYVRVTDATGELNAQRQVGVDAIKFVRRAPTYLPDVRINSSNWNSKIVIRSNGGSAFVDVKFYNVSGALQATQTNTNLAGHGVWEVPLSGLSSLIRSAIVDASQDVVIVVENLKSGEATNYNGLTPSNGLGNAGWGKAGTTIYAPSVKYKLGSPSRTGSLYILNTGSGTATITPTFRLQDNDGNPTTCSSFTLSPLAQRVYKASDCGLSTSNRLYGVKLASNQPLAVVVVEQNDTGAVQAATSNGFSTDVQDSNNYVPLVKSNSGGNSTGIYVQNASPLGSGTTLVNAYYYEQNGTGFWTDSYSLNFYSSHLFWAPNKVSAGKVASAWISGGDKLVSAVYETKLSPGQWRMQYNGFLEGSTTVILPRIYKNYTDGTVIWTTGVTVQNLGSSTSNITIRYYRDDGTTQSNWMETPTPGVAVGQYKAWTFWQGAASNPLPTNFKGSAVITSDQPIVAQVNVAGNTTMIDAAMSYSGFNR